jgi:hypothetical protein
LFEPVRLLHQLDLNQFCAPKSTTRTDVCRGRSREEPPTAIAYVPAACADIPRFRVRNLGTPNIVRVFAGVESQLRAKTFWSLLRASATTAKSPKELPLGCFARRAQRGQS